MPESFTRRTLLQGLVLGASSLTLATSANASSSPTGLTFPASAFAPWVTAENRRPGDPSWLDGVSAPAGLLESYANATSVRLGGHLNLFVSTSSPMFVAKVYRMGYYQGLGARLITTYERVRGTSYPIPSPDQYGTVDCDWPASVSLKIDHRYLPGQYLIRLENKNHEFRFVPFVVRDEASRATFAYMSAVTTWQAYNMWGGYSLYREANSTGTTVLSNAVRAVRVSFNRPYDRAFANGAADFIGNEFPLLFLAEQMGLDLAYWTDIDLHQRGDRLTRHRALLSLGHDEYYSPAMRLAVTNAIARGVNVAFFGANFCYRKIRFEPSHNGVNRLMVNYRSTSDPITASSPSLATVNWSQYPSDQPESTFSGSRYGGAQGAGSMRVEDASSWLWRGSGLSNGAVLANALGGEFNHYDPAGTSPTNVQILAHSPVGGGLSDITYVAEPGHGGVFCTGTGYWIYDLSNAPRLGGRWVPDAVSGVTTPIHTATKNLLALFAGGPAGNTMPSKGNVHLYY